MMKTVRIPIQVKDGRPQLLYGGPLPRLAEGAVGDLVIAAFQVLDEPTRHELERESIRLLLPPNTSLLVYVSADQQDPRIIRRGLPYAPGSVSSGYVSVILREPLRLRLRATKPPALERCRCWIPALKKETASLNEAYTRISTEFEPNRRSHSGNVFRVVMTLVSKPDLPHRWRPLEVLRDREAFRFEAEIGPKLRRLVAEDRQRNGT